MWKQQLPEDFTECLDSTDSCQLNSATGDSGFISSSNSTCYSSSSDFSLSSMSEDVKSGSMESTKCMDSGIDLGLSDTFSQLSMQQMCLEHSNSASESKLLNVDSEKVSTASLEEKESIREPWQLFFAQNNDGDTVLHCTIIQGLETASLNLINATPHPCLLDILNDDAQTALHLAVLTNQPNIVRRLVLAGANLSVRTFQGNTPLHLASLHGYLECAKALTEPFNEFEKNMVNGNLPNVSQDLEQRNYHGETCLHVAASKGHLELVAQLVRAGADVEAHEFIGGRTALHLALEHGRREVGLLLARDCRAHLDAATYAGYTAYDIACYVDKELARELLRLGATPTAFVANDEDEDFRESATFALSPARA